MQAVHWNIFVLEFFKRGTSLIAVIAMGMRFFADIAKLTVLVRTVFSKGKTCEAFSVGNNIEEKGYKLPSSSS